MSELKQKAVVFWQQILRGSKKQKKRIAVLSVLCLSLALFFGALKVAQPKIRHSQLESLITQNVASDQMIVLDYGTEDAKIKQTKAISVMFSQPHGKYFTRVESLLTQKEAELNRTFYYYPVVYDQQAIAKKYQLDPTKVTFIFFQDGKEKNRFVVDDLSDLNQTFIPELNRLPMWRLHQSKNK